MELRNHPKMVFQGHRDWPPDWIPTSGPTKTPVKGEVGVLEEVHFSVVTQSTCYLTIRCSDDRYMGILSFDDSEFAERICELLKQNCGQSIADIGSLDVT